MADQKASSKKYKFKAEITQLLDILVHSLYTHRDIFVRELISNAADALDKVRFEEVRGTEIADPDLDYEIKIELDKDKKLFVITDTGIGMTKNDLINNIGTIAHSGTADFIKQLAAESKESNAGPNLIGKFGVGFYSVYMAGTEVVITTRSFKKDEKAYEWRSDGTGSFTITELDNAPRGTRIEVHLREEALEFAEKYRIESVIRKYSNFVSFPIRINGEQVNTISAIWREPKSTIKDEQYKEFFKFLTNNEEEPLTHLHLSADVPIQFNSLLFIPKVNYEIMGLGEREIGVNLFLRRIMVQDHCKDILPQYLRFVRGVVDSDDLPINISRETLQENTDIVRIKNVLVKKLLSHLEELAQKEPETYKTFWNEFGRIFKEGYSDYANVEKFAELLRFNSSHHENAEGLTSLAEYAERMVEGQKDIFYLSGNNRDSVAKSPHLELFKKKGIEVLFFTEPLDEFVVTGLHKYKDFELKSADQTDPASLKDIKSTTDDAKKDEKKADSKKLGDLCTRIKNILGERVTEVRASERLTDSPAVLVNPDGSMSAQMQKIMQTINKDMKVPAKIMEINPTHPLIENMLKVYQKDAKDAYLTRATENLYYSVMILDGYISDPHKMVEEMQELLVESSNMYTEKF
ncbi:molecular chaperone HtpG [candidate division KSB1 bacterium]|nr:molecular chaperone HtpG [candidate division KSB1 bacterium]